MKTQTTLKLTLIIAITVFITKPLTAQANENAFNKKILTPAKEVRIDALLKLFSEQTGFEFSFNSNKISPSIKLPVPQKSQTLSEWLGIFKQKLGIEYKLMGNHIILSVGDNKSNTKQTGSRLTVPGQIITAKKRETVNVASKSKEHQPPGRPAQKEMLSPDMQIAGTSNNITHTTSVDSTMATPKQAVKKPDNVKKRNTLLPQRKPAGTDTPVLKPFIHRENKKQEGESPSYNNQAIQLTGGYSLHGSGDMKGIVFGTEYIRYLKKRFSLSYNIKATINSGQDELIMNNLVTGERTDASVRFTTAGVQLGVNAGWSFVKSARHDLKISVGPFGRYQSASNGSDGYSVNYPPATGMPAILIGYDNRTPQETFAVGGVLQFQYDYTFRNKFYIGITPGFQTDTNGDAIVQLACALGMRL